MHFIAASIVALLLSCCIVSGQHSTEDISFNPSSLTLQVKSNRNISIRFVNPTFKTTELVLVFTYGDEDDIVSSTDKIAPLPSLNFTQSDSTIAQTVQIQTLNVGQLIIGVKSDKANISATSVLRLSIIHSSLLDVISNIVGWIYFVAWSISFYPQVFLNYKIKDVSGLSFDFISLNFLGHSCYAVFNIALYFSNQVQNEYLKLHPRGVNPVQLNDVLFSMHAVLLTFITIVQCVYYRKQGKRVSWIALMLLTGMISFLAISGVVCALSTKFTLLDYIYFFSFVKLAITIMKYIPQAYVNFKRKSTAGWSIFNVLLDFTGGLFSLLQMFFLAYNYDDWSSIFGSPTKFGLGALSILFDVIFIVQHYVLYTPRRNGHDYEVIED